MVPNKFQMPSWDGTDKMLSDRIADIVGSEFADLSIPKEEDRMEGDLKRSAAGKGAKDRDER